jgi:LPXTG-site transpeptidase (sortase) family protein
VWTLTRRGPDPSEVTLEVVPATALDTPATIPPLQPATDTTLTTTATSSSETVSPGASPDQLSPLATLVGPAGSAIPPDVTPRVRPNALVIPDIDVLRPVRAVGLEGDGQLEVPDETEIGWYQYGAAPGHPGATVLAAHVTWNRTVGPFYRLGELEPGDQVDVALDDGTTRSYEVVERTMYDKDELPRQRIWTNSGPETLVLITCGGDFNPNIRRFRQNIVVYAVPVGQTPRSDEDAR